MPEAKPGWMTKEWSIRVTINNPRGDYAWSTYTTPKPFLATAEEAAAKHEEVKIALSRRPHNFIGYEREAGGEMQSKAADYYTREAPLMRDAITRRVFLPVIDEVIIPSEVLATSIMRVQLIEEAKL